MSTTVDNEINFRTALANGMNLFLGAGFSTLATNSEKEPLPLGKKLKTKLLTAFQCPELKDLSLPEICQMLSFKDMEKYSRIIKQCYAVKQHDPRYEILTKFKFPHICTTNVDNLLELIYHPGTKYSLHDPTKYGYPPNPSEIVQLVHLHGCINDESIPLFSSVDLAAAPEIHKDAWNLFSIWIRNLPTLFWGTALKDPGTLAKLAEKTGGFKSRGDMWIVLDPGADRVEMYEEYYRALNMQFIRYDTSTFLDYLKNQSKHYITPKKHFETFYDEFKQYSIPKLGSLPASPISLFYSGNPPTWDQVLNHRIKPTSYLGHILNAIRSRNHVVIHGIPVCGKSTLLMQASELISQESNVLFLRLPSVPTVKNIIAKLNGRQSIMFIDDVADVTQVVSELLKQENIQLVVSDRTMNIQNTEISRLLFNAHAEFIDASNLSKTEAKSIYSRLPGNIKRRSYKEPRMVKDVDISIFELICANVVKNGIQERYKQLVSKLTKSDNHILLELLLIACYFYRCRVSMSLDTIGSFFSADKLSYSHIEHYLSKLELVLVEATGYGVKDEHGGLIPRSRVVSETIWHSCPGEIKKDLIWKFHKNVSTWTIVRYDIFQKYAYDSLFVKEIFPDVEEGIKFYEYIYSRDNSPYRLQQGALYLASYGRYKKAHDWIDRAIEQCGYKALSIVNSSAFILFKANEHLDARNAEVRENLRQSMLILKDCYHKDMRKVMHVTTFAEQAVKYHKRYNDSESLEFLQTAYDWLVDELNQYESHFVRKKLDLVSRQLRKTISTIVE